MKATLWAWVFQRITAALLIVLTAIHFGIMHFIDPTVEIDFLSSSMRLQGALYFLVDAGLLILGLFHGLNGIRNILLDYWPNAGRAAGWVLGLIGAAAAGYGSTALLIFLK